MEITSLQNKKVKYWCSLKQKKTRDTEKVFLVEGDHLLEEAKKANALVETISIENKKADYLVTKEIMQKISSQQSISNNVGVCKFLEEKEIAGNILILDNIQDPGNLGTIMRSASAFNFTTLILSLDTVDQYNEKVIRASEGLIFNQNIKRCNLEKIIPILKSKGYLVIGTDVKSGTDIRSMNHQNIAIVIGNEGKGISSNIAALCDNFVKIPMMNTCESLNAGIAASILMYEVYHD